jgi:uncharacterized protein
MDFEFDPAKDVANRHKHGMALEVGLRVFDDPQHQVFPSIRPVDGEDRYKAVGSVNQRLHTVVYVWRGETIRLISVRRSNAGEQRDYDRHSR